MFVSCVWALQTCWGPCDCLKCSTCCCGGVEGEGAIEFLSISSSSSSSTWGAGRKPCGGAPPNCTNLGTRLPWNCWPLGGGPPLDGWKNMGDCLISLWYSSSSAETTATSSRHNAADFIILKAKYIRNLWKILPVKITYRIIIIFVGTITNTELEDLGIFYSEEHFLRRR